MFSMQFGLALNLVLFFVSLLISQLNAENVLVLLLNQPSHLGLIDAACPFDVSLQPSAKAAVTVTRLFPNLMAYTGGWAPWIALKV